MFSAYKHFILNLNPVTTRSDYYRRAVRLKDKIVFDINRQSKNDYICFYYFNILAQLWKSSEGSKTAYGNLENETILGLAYKAVYLDGAIVGVVGMEFLYDKLVEKMKDIGCLPDVNCNFFFKFKI